MPVFFTIFVNWLMPWIYCRIIEKVAQIFYQSKMEFYWESDVAVLEICHTPSKMLLCKQLLTKRYSSCKAFYHIKSLSLWRQNIRGNFVWWIHVIIRLFACTCRLSNCEQTPDAPRIKTFLWVHIACNQILKLQPSCSILYFLIYAMEI